MDITKLVGPRFRWAGQNGHVYSMSPDGQGAYLPETRIIITLDPPVLSPLETSVLYEGMDALRTLRMYAGQELEGQKFDAELALVQGGRVLEHKKEQDAIIAFFSGQEYRNGFVKNADSVDFVSLPSAAKFRDALRVLLLPHDSVLPKFMDGLKRRNYLRPYVMDSDLPEPAKRAVAEIAEPRFVLPYVA